MTKILVAVALAVALAVGVLVGVQWEQASLPDCAEDELLVPVEYPYGEASDLRCVHIDAVVAEVNG